MSFAGIFIAVAVTGVVVLIVHGAFSAGREGLARIFATAAAAVVGIILFGVILGALSFDWRHASRSSEWRPVAPATAERQIVTVVETRERHDQNLPSTEALWDRLTKARIPLDGEDASEGSAEPAEDAEEVADAKPSRPAWVDEPPTRVGGVYRRVVASDRFSTIDECYRQLEEKYVDEVERRLRIVLGDQVAADSRVPVDVGIDYIMREICREAFAETVDMSVGEMKLVHVLMEFTPAIDQHLRQTWESHEHERQAEERLHRLVGVGGAFAVVLAMLAALYGLLRFDTWTRGYYTKRLIVAVPVVIILVAVLLTL